MKRMVLAGAAVVVLVVAGVAFAYGPGMGRGVCGAAGGECVMAQGGASGCGGPCGFRGSRRMRSLDDGDCRFGGRKMMGRREGRMDVPAELRTKMTEMEKTRLQLRLAMMENPVDQAKARDLFAKIQSLRSEMAAWRFERMLAEQVKENAAANVQVPAQGTQAVAPSSVPSK